MIRNSLQMLIENAFSKHFHFEQEILQSWVEKQITQTKARNILKPVMPMRKKKIYNPFLAFGPQYVKKKRIEEEQKMDVIDETALESQMEMLERQQQEIYKKEMEALKIILTPLLEKKRYFISEIIKEMKQKDANFYCYFENDLLHHFLNISVKMHRSSYKEFEYLRPEEITYHPNEVKMLAELVREKPELEEIGKFEMIATERVLEFENGIIVTDYIIERVEDNEL